VSYEQERKQSRELTKKFEDPVPERIYHYTSPENFKSIVDSHEIWLSNVGALDDTTDCKAFWECAEELVEDEKRLEEEEERLDDVTQSMVEKASEINLDLSFLKENESEEDQQV